jgi:hypothetical protein
VLDVPHASLPLARAMTLAAAPGCSWPPVATALFNEPAAEFSETARRPRRRASAPGQGPGYRNRPSRWDRPGVPAGARWTATWTADRAGCAWSPPPRTGVGHASPSWPDRHPTCGTRRTGPLVVARDQPSRTPQWTVPCCATPMSSCWTRSPRRSTWCGGSTPPAAPPSASCGPACGRPAGPTNRGWTAPCSARRVARQPMARRT